MQAPADGEVARFAVFAGGFAAVEAEFVFRLGADAPADKTEYSDAEAAALVDALLVGVELAGSPLPLINVLGPPIVVSDFGNNAGLILGAEIPDWRRCRRPTLRCETFIDGASVGTRRRGFDQRRPARGAAPSRCRAAPVAATRCKAGMLVTTGAATGIHDIVAGQDSRISFGGWGELHCRRRAAASRPRSRTARMTARRRFLRRLRAPPAPPRALPALRAAAGRARMLTATDVHVKDYPTVAAVRWIGEQLERETGGRLRLRLYHSGQLGRESEAIDMARFGAIDITRVYSGALNNAFPLTQVLSLPYVFDSVRAPAPGARRRGRRDRAARLRRARPGRPGDLRQRRALLLQHAPPDRTRRPTCTA